MNSALKSEQDPAPRRPSRLTCWPTLAVLCLAAPVVCTAAAPPSFSTGSDWGEPVQGLSGRLSTDRRLWDLAQPHQFKLSVRNQGQQTVAVARTQVAGELEADGVWYEWSNPVDVKFSPLNPGDRIDDIGVSTYGPWRRGSNFLLAGPGKHRLRFAVLVWAEGGGRLLRVVSNPIDVEFAWGARATNPPVTFVAADAPVIADIAGRVLDAETGEPITDFWVQEGMVDPEKLHEIIWGESYVGPIMSGPQGRFSLQARKAGQTWRVLADGYLPELLLKQPINGRTPSTEVVVRCKRGGELKGTVLDHLGQPVAGARVLLTTDQTPELTDGVPGQTFRGSSTTTDAAGRFVLRGVGGSRPKVLVVSPDALQICPATTVQPGQELQIAFPRPAALRVRYDVAGDEPEAQLTLTFRASDLGFSRQSNVRTALQPKVPNGGEIVLTNLTPGTYEFHRSKMLRAGDEQHGVAYERRTIVLDAAQSQEINLVRSNGYPVEGTVLGLDQTEAAGGFIYVRSAIATGDPRAHTEWLLPTFEALVVGKDGSFKTARLAPGDYTIVAHVYGPEPVYTQTIGGRQARVFRTGIRLPEHVGIARMTVTADDPPTPIQIELR